MTPVSGHNQALLLNVHDFADFCVPRIDYLVVDLHSIHIEDLDRVIALWSDNEHQKVVNLVPSHTTTANDEFGLYGFELLFFDYESNAFFF